MAAPGRFSGAVMLGDLNDFIAPAVECIKPVQIRKPEPANGKEAGLAAVHIGEDGQYYEVSRGGQETRLEQAKISLNDCLACSGCVTSAETVLIQMQSDEEVMRVVAENRAAVEGRSSNYRHLVVTVAPQVRASFAAKYGLTTLQVARRLTHFFKSALDAQAVFDTNFGRDIALIETTAEFLGRFRENRGLPMLASSCPGWICYAEKTHPQVLPHISAVKSPMQVMGVLVKEYYGAKTLGVTPDKVYHVSVMPCYDKKLEASRTDFFNEAYRTRDVDCVITSIEVEQMIARTGETISSLPEAELDFALTKARVSPTTGQVELLGSEGSSAGGALEYVFRHAAQELFGVTVDQLAYRAGRNADTKDLDLQANGQAALRFACSYGFRNIQNLVRKVKATRGPQHHFVEVMACPSACANGGGQLRPEGATMMDKTALAQVEATYASDPVSPPNENAGIADVYAFFNASPGSDAARAKFHTQYHALEKLADTTGLAVQW